LNAAIYQRQQKGLAMLRISACGGALLAVMFLVSPPLASAVPLLAVDFGESSGDPLQGGFQEMNGEISQAAASATFGAWSVDLTGQGFADSNNGAAVALDIMPLYRDYYYNNSEINGEGVTLSITGATPNQPYSLTVWSYDADQVFSSTPTTWTPYGDTTGGVGEVTNFATPRPDSLDDYSTTFQVTSTTGVIDVFGTTTSGFGGTRLNAFRLNDGNADVFSVDFGRPALPVAPVQTGFQGMKGLQTQASATQTFGAYTVTVEGQGYEDTSEANANEIDASIRDLYRGTYYNNSETNGIGVTLRIEGVTPNTDYDLKVWSYDPAQAFSSTPTEWTPINSTTGTTGEITNFAFPRPTTLDDRSATLRVRSTTSTLEVFGTTTAGFGGTRLNAFELNAVTAGIPGDFNGDSMVDGSDLTIWKNNVGMQGGASSSVGDADSDEDVDGADFLVWQRNVGAPSAALATTSIPEPTAAMLLLLSALACIRGRRSLPFTTRLRSRS
jgi:hypothetical protein